VEQTLKIGRALETKLMPLCGRPWPPGQLGQNQLIVLLADNTMSLQGLHAAQATCSPSFTPLLYIHISSMHNLQAQSRRRTRKDTAAGVGQSP